MPPSSGGPADDRDEVEREDELPTVVVLRQGDVGEQEFLDNRQKVKEEGTIIIGTVSQHIGTMPFCLLSSYVYTIT